MRPQDKNKMVVNLRTFLNKEDTSLQEHQNEVLHAAEQFLVLPKSTKFVQLGDDTKPVTGVKKGDFFEVVSATGSGKTRMFGTLAKAMNVQTLIVTPRNILNEQTKKEFCDEIGIPPSSVAVYDSKQSRTERRRVLEGNPPPQFVITSYQSLPSLLDRHELELTNHKDPHYRPLVILDEVHEGQGPQTSATINKLKDKVLVAGFTATDAGAHNSLFSGQEPIYRLPLVAAIERGLLCKGIRTGVIDVAIDEDWVKNFQKTEKGKNYSPADIEHFARTPAVIKGALSFHFQHKDIELGQLYKLPSVFYTQGVTAAREGAEQYNKMAKRLGLKQRAAYVSGDMADKAKPIIEQFNRGELDAIFNDRLLGMGWNARNATVCYSLRPSNVPDVVEQQLGRVGRKQGADYKKKYGHDKVALAINVRPEGTNPYLFAQILESPALYSRHVPEQEKYSGETLNETPLKIPGVKFHLNYNTMKTVLADANKLREGNPEKTVDWIGASDMARLTKASIRTTSPKYQALHSEWLKARAEGSETFGAEGITLRTDQAGIFKTSTHSIFCLHKEAKEQFMNPVKTADWMGVVNMSRAVSKANMTISPIYAALEAAWQKAKLEGKDTFAAEGVLLPVDKAARMRAGTQVIFCLHKDAVPQFKSAERSDEWLGMIDMSARTGAGRDALAVVYRDMHTAWLKARETGKSTFTAAGITLPVDKASTYKHSFRLHQDAMVHFNAAEKTDEWLTIAEMSKNLHTAHEKISPIYKALEEAYAAAKKANKTGFTAAGITVPIEKAGYFKNHSQKPFCLHKDIAAQLAKPQKTAEWLGIVGMSAEVGSYNIKISPIYAELLASWQKAKKADKTEFSALGVTIPTDMATAFQKGSRVDFCVHKNAAGAIRAILDNKKAAAKPAAHAPESFVSRTGKAKSFLPGSPDLKRKDRTRSDD